MLDRIIAALALALFSYLEKRIERGHVARDAPTDRARLRRGGARIREWLRAHGADSRSGSTPRGE